MRMIRGREVCCLVSLWAVTLTLAVSAREPPRKPAGEEAPAHEAMAVAANPLAVEAGIEILRKGGSAVDAAVAIQTMLGLVEPQSSGVGGGAFMLYYDQASGLISALDGREKAPAGATPDMFLD